MANRILRPGILTSDKVDLLSWPAEVFYRRLMSVVDDFGRFDARPPILRSCLYPLKLSKVSEADIVKWMNECSEAALISIYHVAYKPYLEVDNFNQALRIKKNKYPGPNDETLPIESPAGYIYFIGTHEENPIKIGFSLNPWARVKEISTGSSVAYYVLHYFKGVKTDEKQLHQLLNDYRIRKEWFKIPLELFRLAKEFKSEEENGHCITEFLRSKIQLLRSSTEVEVEVETETEVEKGAAKAVCDVFKKNLLKNKNFSIEFPFAEKFNEAWEQWKQYKFLEFKFRYKSPQSEQAAINDLVKIGNGNEETCIEVIHQSMAKGWKGFFELKNDYGKSNSTNKRSTGANVNTSSILSKVAAMPD